MKCDVCGSNQFLSYKCRHCGGSFCTNHRLPEQHGCNVNWGKYEGLIDKTSSRQRGEIVEKQNLYKDMPEKREN